MSASLAKFTKKTGSCYRVINNGYLPSRIQHALVEWTLNLGHAICDSLSSLSIMAETAGGKANQFWSFFPVQRFASLLGLAVSRVNRIWLTERARLASHIVVLVHMH